MTDRIQTAALRSTLRRAVDLGQGCRRQPGNPIPCPPFSYRELDRAADQLAHQLNDEAALRMAAERRVAELEQQLREQTERLNAARDTITHLAHGLEVTLDTLRGGDVDEALHHGQEVLLGAAR